MTKTKTKTKAKKPAKRKYKIGDIVGVCADAMYEFEIVGYNAHTPTSKKKGYACKCVRSYTKTIKVGDMHCIYEKQIVVKLGEK